MFQLSPPDLFASGIEHTLFIGFRPLLVRLNITTLRISDSLFHIPDTSSFHSS